MQKILLINIVNLCFTSLLFGQNAKPFTIEVYSNLNTTLPFVNYKNPKAFQGIPEDFTGATISINPSNFKTEIKPRFGYSFGAAMEFEIKKRKNMNFLTGIEYAFLRYRILHTAIWPNSNGTVSGGSSNPGTQVSYGQIVLPAEFKLNSKKGHYLKFGISLDILLHVKEKNKRLRQETTWTSEPFDPFSWTSTLIEYEEINKSRENYNDANISTRLSAGFKFNSQLSMEVRHRRKLGGVHKELSFRQGHKVSLNLHSIELGMNYKIYKSDTKKEL